MGKHGHFAMCVMTAKSNLHVCHGNNVKFMCWCTFALDTFVQRYNQGRDFRCNPAMLYRHRLDLPKSLLRQGASVQSQPKRHIGTSPKPHVHGLVDQGWLEVGRQQDRSLHVVVALPMSSESHWIWHLSRVVQQGEQS